MIDIFFCRILNILRSLRRMSWLYAEGPWASPPYCHYTQIMCISQECERPGRLFRPFFAPQTTPVPPWETSAGVQLHLLLPVCMEAHLHSEALCLVRGQSWHMTSVDLVPLWSCRCCVLSLIFPDVDPIAVIWNTPSLHFIISWNPFHLPSRTHVVFSTSCIVSLFWECFFFLLQL